MLSTLSSRMGAPQLIQAACLMLCAGLVAVFSASHVPGDLERDGLTHLLYQLRGVAIGGAAITALYFMPPHWLERSGYVAWGIGVLAVAATLLTPLGLVRNNAQRWLVLGPVTLQPLELTKLGLLLGLAQWFADKGERVNDLRVSIAVPAGMIALPALALMLQPDLGGTLVLMAIGAIVMFVAGARASHLAFVIALVLPVIAVSIATSDYQWERIFAFWNPDVDQSGNSYQARQSIYAFGGGGLLGMGLGAGVQKLYFLPEPHTDFILAVIGEELGLVGVWAVLAGFACVALSSLGIATRARDLHGMLIAAGAGALLWLQGVINAGVALDVLPTKGTTLPLFSYGRSSLVASLIAVGLILHVARPANRERKGWR